MPTNSSELPSLPESFSVSLNNNSAHIVHFKKDGIYIDNQLLTTQNQKNFLDLYADTYRAIRHRNFGWRFLSACHDYFNGQLQEIQQLKTEEEKIRYLFSHAQKKPGSKTAEALQLALTLFCVQPNYSQPGQKNALASCVESKIIYPHNQITHFAPKTPQPTPVIRSNCHDRFLRWIDEAFHTIWQLPSINKVASVQFEPRHLKYYLFFYTDCAAAIAKSNAGFFTTYNPFDHTIKRETEEAEWGKQLYDSLDHFRRHVNKSNGSVKEIHNAFNELVKQIHLDPPNFNSGYIKNSPFHHAVTKLRTQLIAIHIEWRKTVEAEAATDTQQNGIH